jgi:hypothetical protein
VWTQPSEHTVTVACDMCMGLGYLDSVLIFFVLFVLSKLVRTQETLV